MNAITSQLQGKKNKIFMLAWTVFTKKFKTKYLARSAILQWLVSTEIVEFAGLAYNCNCDFWRIEEL